MPGLKTETKGESKATETKNSNAENKAALSQRSNESKLPAEKNKSWEEIPYKIPKKEVFALNGNYMPVTDVLAYHRSAPSGIIYLENLKTINYSKTYSGSPPKSQGILNNVVAQYENKEQQHKRQNELQKNTYAISYEKALSDGLRNYNKGLFHQAVNDFDVILRQFPEDLNCKFYKALCYESTRKFAEAEKLFSEIMDDPDDSFFEEARWHLAVCKIKLEEIGEAKNILKQIISGNGFYKSKAETMLKALK